MIGFITNRLKEHTTWYGMVLVAASFGLQLDPTQQESLIYLGMAMAGTPDMKMPSILKKLLGREPSNEQ